LSTFSSNILFIPVHKGIPVLGDRATLPAALMTIEKRGGEEAADSVYDATQAVFDRIADIGLEDLPESSVLSDILEEFGVERVFFAHGVAAKEEIERALVHFGENSDVGPRVVENSIHFAEPTSDELTTEICAAKYALWRM